PGTGNGIVGGYVAIALGLIAPLLAALSTARLRRTGPRGLTDGPDLTLASELLSPPHPGDQRFHGLDPSPPTGAPFPLPADLVHHRVGGEPGIVADVVQHQGLPPDDDVRAVPVLTREGAGLQGRLHRLRDGAAGVQAAQVLTVLVDEVDHRQRGPRESADL